MEHPPYRPAEPPPGEAPPGPPVPPPIPPAPAAFAPGTAPAAPAWNVAPTRTSGQAIAALVCAAVGLLGAWLILPLVASCAGVVLGHLALGTIGRSGGYLRGRGLAVAALVCGYGAALVWVALLLV